MLAWSTKRKLQYLGIIIVFILIFFVLPFYAFIYEAPNCFDGLKNGSETGVDCGGNCRLLCPADNLDPIMRWDPRIFHVSENVYNVLAYIENPNINAEVRYAPYAFKIYDADGDFIVERRGVTFIPKGRTFAVFDGNFNLGDKVPTKATFEFVGDLKWTKNVVVEPDIEVTSSTLLDEKTKPRVEATVKNGSFDRLQNIELVAIVFDGAGNAIGASRTLVDSLGATSEQNITFTWPLPFQTALEVCSSPVDVAIAVDRSGSMASLGENPPQPLTDVKEAVIDFVNKFSNGDRAAVISFAGTASVPADESLTSDLSRVRDAVSAIRISSEGTQYTNIADALLKSDAELGAVSNESDNRKVIVLLTDGIANKPEKEDNPNYAEEYAVQISKELKEKGVKVFTIGLGKDVNQNFLKTVASSTDEFYPAPTANNLSSVYSSIATKICQKKPAVIEIIPRIYPRLE